MRMLQSILVATDLRPESQDVIKAAIEIARVFGSEITLLHVMEPLPTWPIALYEEKEQLTAPLEEQARGIRDRKTTVTSLLAVGPAASTIVRKAQEIDADLILIGAGRQSNFDAFRAGTVAQAVLEHAVQPVLAIRPGKAKSLFRKILCPTDHSVVSARGLNNAIRLARAFESELHVVSVIPEMRWLSAAVETGTATAPQTEHERRWREEFEKFVETIDFEKVRWTREVREGPPAEEILKCAAEQQADLIVMGSTGRTGLVRMLLGSVTRRVLQHLPCSLLTVKDEDVVEQIFEDDLRQVNLLTAEGRELLKNGCYLPALTKLRQVTAINPFHREALHAQAEAHEKLGQYEEAEACRSRARRLLHHEEVGAV